MNVRTRYRRLRALTSLCCLLHAAVASAQVNVAGQASAAWMRSQGGPSQYAFNEGRGSFAWRGDLFVDAELSGNVFFLSSFRMDQDRRLDVDLFAIRLTELFSLPLSIDAGEIDVPFANLGERRFPRSNPFLTLPLGREHGTSLLGSRYELAYDSYSYDDRLRIIDGGLYDIGVKLFGTAGILDFAVAITNGMISAGGSYSAGGLNGSKGVGKVARIALTPVIGLTFGASIAHGPFMKENRSTPSGPAYPTDVDPLQHPQEAVAGDIDFSFEHFTFYGEAYFSSWDLADEYGAPLEAFGYSAEARYAPLPRISAALRVGQLLFNKVDNPAYGPAGNPVAWDHDVLRVDAALGYRISRELILKAVFSVQRTYGLAEDPRDNTFGLQTVVSF